MKKIINGKKYDTETASEIWCYWNGLSITDFHYKKERLYKKKTGEFFLYGEGGGLSGYARHYGDGWGFGEKIIPLTENEAKEWAEEHLDGDDYEKIFGEVEE